MRKFLLVTLIGMALAMNLYGFVNEFIMIDEVEDVEDVDHIEETTTMVYVE